MLFNFAKGLGLLVLTCFVGIATVDMVGIQVVWIFNAEDMHHAKMFSMTATLCSCLVLAVIALTHKKVSVGIGALALVLYSVWWIPLVAAKPIINCNTCELSQPVINPVGQIACYFSVLGILALGLWIVERWLNPEKGELPDNHPAYVIGGVAVCAFLVSMTGVSLNLF